MRPWPVALVVLGGCPWISAGELADRNDLDGDGVVGLFDCDDRDAGTGLAAAWLPDEDGDGHGAGAPITACDPPEGYVASADDCDDADPAVSPAASERCNQVDDDCDGRVDDDDEVAAADLATFYPDLDRDGWPDEAGRAVLACEPPLDHVAPVGAWDCDDANIDVSPAAPEACADAVDNDCDGAIDEEGDAEAWVPDLDGDGFAGAETPTPSCSPPPGYVRPATLDGRLDCNDGDPAVHPNAVEVCGNLADDDCDLVVDDESPARPVWYPDDDGDGYRGGAEARRWCREAMAGWVLASEDRGPDCDDGDPETHPDAAEVPYDGVDQDCVDGDLVDVDGDGWDASLDCDDQEPLAHPGGGQVERCDGVDNDCDRVVDVGAVDAPLWYLDADGDGYAASPSPFSACADRAPVGSAPLGAVVGFDDCDDADPDTHPDADERWYDGVDGDCAGGDDFDQDADGSPIPDDCDDLDPAQRPDPAGEAACADGVDDDCDGIADFLAQPDVGAPYLPDADFDGFPDATAAPVDLCRPVAGFVAAAAVRTPDCDDTDPGVAPGVPDPVDGRDRDCDGLDSDRDGDGDPDPEDCAGDDPSVFHGAPERCDAVDQDCDGDPGWSLPIATAVVGGEELDVTDTYATLSLAGVERLRLCGPVERSAAWTAGPNDTVVEVYGGTLTGVPLLVDGPGAGQVTFEGGTLVAHRSGPLVDLGHGGSLVLSAVDVDGGGSPVVALAGGASLFGRGGAWTGGSADAVTCSGCGAVDLDGLTVQDVGGRLVRVEGVVGLRPRVTVTGTQVQGGGGLVDATDADVELVLVSVTDGFADRGGAARLLRASLTATATSFLGNVAAFDGGALSAVDSDLDLEAVTFDGNGAEDGGSVSISGGSLLEVRSLHRGNVSAGDGGALWADATTVVSDDSSYLGNEASAGGAVTLSSGALGTWSAFAVADNVSSRVGGGFAVEASVLLVLDGRLEGNQSASGGALWYLTPDVDTAIFGGQVSFSRNVPSDVNGVGLPSTAKFLVCLGSSGTCL